MSVSYHFYAAKMAHSLDNSQLMGLFAEGNVRVIEGKKKNEEDKKLSLSLIKNE